MPEAYRRLKNKCIMKEKIKFEEIVPPSNVLEEELGNIYGGKSADSNVCLKGCVTGDKKEKPVESGTKEEAKP